VFLTILLEPFFLTALAAGLGVALLTAPLGCFVLWQRLNYFGDALAHSTLLGLVLSIWLDLPAMVGVIILCLAMALLIGVLQRSNKFSMEGLVGLISHSALAIGLMLTALFPHHLSSVFSLMFGDILAVDSHDVLWIGMGIICLGIWLYSRFEIATLFCIDPDLAAASPQHLPRIRLELLLLLAAVVALSIKIVGVLLMAAMLIIPPHIGRVFAKTPLSMMVFSIISALLSVVLGLLASALWDTPAGPSIISASTVLFVLAAFLRRESLFRL
jgi:zinc transport system permease protein